jgi:hypothetical protein
MNRYQSHKIVEAAKITSLEIRGDAKELTLEGEPETYLLEGAVLERISMASAQSVANGRIVDGWLVIYPDGYVSWSPAEAFEDGYGVVQPSSGQSKIAGYRQLNEGEVVAINDVKGVGAMLGDFVEIQRNDPDCDQRWVSVGATHLQQGLMALVRAIAKPDFF